MGKNETPGGTDGNERNEDFRERFEGMTDQEKWEYTQELRATQSGQDRKIGDLQLDNKALAQALRQYKDEAEQSKAVESEENQALLDDLAELRAQKALIKRQSETLQRAAENGVPLDAAIRFAELDDAPDLVDRIGDAISERANQIVSQKLADSNPHMEIGEGKPGHIQWEDILNMSPDEQRRIPQAIIDRAMREAG